MAVVARVHVPCPLIGNRCNEEEGLQWPGRTRDLEARLVFRHSAVLMLALAEVAGLDFLTPAENTGVR